MISSLLHLVGLRPRVYYTLTNFRGGGKAPLAPPPQYANAFSPFLPCPPWLPCQPSLLSPLSPRYLSFSYSRPSFSIPFSPFSPFFLPPPPPPLTFLSYNATSSNPFLKFAPSVFCNSPWFPSITALRINQTHVMECANTYMYIREGFCWPHFVLSGYFITQTF